MMMDFLRIGELQKEFEILKQKIENLEKSKNICDIDENSVGGTENVCRIDVDSRIFDWCQPPNRNKSTSGTGTGFVIQEHREKEDEIIIVTAHHVVSDGIEIKVNFNKISSDDIPAKIIGCNPEMDIAILCVKVDDDLKKQITGFKLGDSDHVDALKKVKAMGFALGKPHLQITAGVISGRISKPSRLQIDVAVNPGNSGGPLLDMSNNVVGVVTSGISDAQGINYAAPINESIIMIKRMLKESIPKVSKSLTAAGAFFDRIPSLNAKFTKANKVLLRCIPDNDKNCHGIYCTAVHHEIEYPQTLEACMKNLESYHDLRQKLESKLVNESLEYGMSKSTWQTLLSKYFTMPDTLEFLSRIRNETIQKGDIILSIIVNGKEYSIDNQMNAKFDFWNDNILFTSILDRLAIGDMIQFKIYRKNCDAQKCFKIIQHFLHENKNVCRELYSDTEEVPYLSLAGLFTMPLLLNHMNIFKKQNMYDLMNTPMAPHTSMLLVTHILPESPFKEEKTVGIGDIIVGINNQKVRTIYQLEKMWQPISK